MTVATARPLRDTARRVLVALAAGLAVAGCGADGRDPGPAAGASPAPLGLTAVATQTREDVAAGGVFHVRITNRGQRPVEVTALQLRSPGFAPQPPTRPATEIPPGVTYDLAATYGPVRCTPPEPGTQTVVLQTRADGQVRTDEVPLASPDGLMARLHAEGCAQAALLQQVSIQLLPELRDTTGQPSPAGVAGTLRVRRLDADEALHITDVRGTVLYDLAAPALPAVLAPGRAELDVPVLFSTATCEGHAIGEAKQPYLFRVLLAVGGEPPVATELSVSAEQRRALRSFQTRSCAGRQ